MASKVSHALAPATLDHERPPLASRQQRSDKRPNSRVSPQSLLTEKDLDSSAMDLRISCRCGEVAGEVRNFTRGSTNRGVCYCKDCRGAARWLGCDDLLDSYGGVDIFQVAQGHVAITRGSDRLAAMRLSPKGLWRAYTTCCNTPFGNTMSAAMPFVGLPVALVPAERRDELPTPIPFNEKSALAPVPDVNKWAQAKMIGHFVKLMFGWKLRGMNKPSIYFDDQGTSRFAPRILTLDERREASAGSVRSTNDAKPQRHGDSA